MRPSEQHPFERKIVDGTDRRLIESKCALCGFRIVGSALNSLQSDEDDHASTCSNRQDRSPIH